MQKLAQLLSDFGDYIFFFLFSLFSKASSMIIIISHILIEQFLNVMQCCDQEKVLENKQNETS